MKKVFTIIALFIFTLSLYSCTKSTPVKNERTPSISNQSTEAKQNYSNRAQNYKPKEVNPKVQENNTGNSHKVKETYLSLGSNGEEVKTLQTKLNKFKYNVIVDGEFGELTDFAVRNFQDKANISSDGIVGTETMKKLDSTPAEAPYLYKDTEKKLDSSNVSNSTNSYEAFINSKNCSSATGYYIYTSLSKHVVFIFTGSNHNWNLINSFSCSVGSSSTPTITGYFTVGTKGSYFVTDNGLICKYFTQINGNYLFHSILYDKNGYVVDNRLGLNISHGCIRLATENAKYIYNNIPYRTTIWIQR